MTRKRIGTVLTIMLLIAVVRYCLAVPPLTPAQLQIELAQLDITEDIREELELLRTQGYKSTDEDRNDIAAVLQSTLAILRIALSPLTFTGRLIVFAFRVIGFMPLTTATEAVT